MDTTLQEAGQMVETQLTQAALGARLERRSLDRARHRHHRLAEHQPVLARDRLRRVRARARDRRPRRRDRRPGMAGRGWLVLSSLAGIAVGVIVFLWTDMSALALLYVIGAYAITLGIIAVGGAFWLPLDARRQRPALADRDRLDPLRHRDVREAGRRRARSARPDRRLRAGRRPRPADGGDRRQAAVRAEAADACRARGAEDRPLGRRSTSQPCCAACFPAPRSAPRGAKDEGEAHERRRRSDQRRQSSR